MSTIGLVAEAWLVAIVIALAPAAQAQTQVKYSDLQLDQGAVTQAASVIEAFHADKILNMPVKKVLVILVGVGVGMYIAENFVPFTFGIPTNIIGILLGAMIGNYWYEQRLFPLS